MKKLTLKKKSTEVENLRQTVAELKAKLEELKRENADLLYSLDEYTKKENSIFESIGYIEEKKREHTKNLNAKYAIELDKLRFFENKWFNMVKNCPDPTMKHYVRFTREKFDQCRDEIVSRTRAELKMVKTETPAEEDFLLETERLDRQRDTFADAELENSDAYLIKKALNTAKNLQFADTVAETNEIRFRSEQPLYGAPASDCNATSKPPERVNSDTDFITQKAAVWKDIGTEFVKSERNTPKIDENAPVGNIGTEPLGNESGAKTTENDNLSVETRVKKGKMTDKDILSLLERFSV